METKVNKTPLKRQRSENWLVEDKRLLMDLVRERVKAIENKNTDSNTNAKKLAAWTDLCSSFNSMCNGGPRTVAQLKAQWGIIKMVKKKEKSSQRKALLMTGGGPPPERNSVNDNDDIDSWLPNEFIIDGNEFDSDQINLNKAVEPSPKEIKLESTTDQNAENVTVQGAVHEAVQEVTQENVTQDQNTPKVTSKPSLINRPSGSRRRLPKAPVKKKESEDKTNYAANIAATEIECRKQLHEIQMENEKKRARNLDLEEILIKKKIEYFEKKIKENK